MTRKYLWLILLMAIIGTLACQLSNLVPAQVPTATPTATRKPTPAPTQVPPIAQALPPTPAPELPTAVPAPVIAQITENVRVRSAPSTSAAILDRLNKGDKIQILGRTPANDWFLVPLPSKPNGRGWFSAQYAQLSGPLDSIPIVPPGQGVYP